MKKVLFAAAALALAGTPAFAQPHQVTVEIRDLNLSTPQGQRRLEQRIDTAARLVCGLGDIRTGSHIASQEARACHRGAVAQARNHVATLAEQNSKGG